MKVTIARKIRSSEFSTIVEWLEDNYDFSHDVILNVMDGSKFKRTRQNLLTLSNYHKYTIVLNHTFFFEDHNIGMVFALKFDGRIHV